MALVIAEGPQLPDEQRMRSFIQEITEVTCKHLGINPWDLAVLVREEGGSRMSHGSADTVAWDGDPV